jgi:hypothetical protein
MMFLLRLAFWITVVCLLLPDSREDTKKLIASARKTAEDVRGFCERNPDVCRDAQVTATTVVTKVKNGIAVMEAWLASAAATSETADKPEGLAREGTRDAAKPASGSAQHEKGSYAEQNDGGPPRMNTRWNSTLKDADKVPDWRGPQPKL